MSGSTIHPPDSPDEHPPALDSTIAERVVDQTFDLWIKPEVARRQAAGTLPADFMLLAAQVVMQPGQPPEVRLNAEVRFAYKAQARQRIEAGESAVAGIDTGPITEVALFDEDANAGHISITRVGDELWALAFDFRYNTGRIGEVLATAREFLDAVADALRRGHRRAAIDTLFSAVELLALGRLLQLPGTDLLKSKHGKVHGHFNRFGQHAINVDPRFVKLFNEIREARSPARYPVPERPVTMTMDNLRERLGIAEEMHADLTSRLPDRPPKGDRS